MEYPVKNSMPYEEIENGALILLLLRESKTWEELCGRNTSADPTQLKINTTIMTLLNKLFDMRDLGLLHFQDALRVGWTMARRGQEICVTDHTATIWGHPACNTTTDAAQPRSPRPSNTPFCDAQHSGKRLSVTPNTAGRRLPS